MDQKVIDLYDEYTHAPLDRRVFLERLATLTGSVAAAMAALPLLENRAVAAVVAPDDARVTAEMVEFPGQDGTMKGYLAKPASGAKFGAVVVIHENRGLNAHIEDVAAPPRRRRLPRRWRSISCRRSAARPPTRTRPAT